jgi:hypothetical protein
VAIGVAAIVVVPRFTAARPNPFVTRSGSTLFVNRHVLRFSGANIWLFEMSRGRYTVRLP